MRHDDMDGDIAKLIQLLKKIMKEHPAGSDMSKLMDQKSFNINLCFLTLVPMTPEDLEEFEEIYEQYADQAEDFLAQKQKAAKLEFKLSPDDAKFLKQNGILF